MPDLTDELQQMADQAARQAQPPAAADILRQGDRRRRRAITRWSAGGVTAAAAVVGITLAVTSAPGASHPAAHQAGVQLAAWTVTKLADGNVSFTVREFRDPAGMQRTLRADGVPASVLSAGQPNPCQNYPAGQSQLPQVMRGQFPKPLEATSIVGIIHPSALPSGAGLQFVAGQNAGYPQRPGPKWITFRLVQTSQACTGS
jgi:hypothetical protein